MPNKDRFLLIKSSRAGFWSDMHNVWGNLLLAEITNRCPVVFWGEFSRYSVGDNVDAFTKYFLPVSDCSLRDLVNPQFTYDPPEYNPSNIYQEIAEYWKCGKRDIPSCIASDANVLVSETHHCAQNAVRPWVKEGHPAYGLQGDDLFRYIIDKYIKLQPEIEREIEEFYHTNRMDAGPVVAVHIRSGDRHQDVPHLDSINADFPQEINNYLNNNPSARIFLLTESESVIEQYKQMHGDILIYTDCNRKVIDGLYPVLQIFPDKIRKGIEIIKDSYLACKCDHFIGNGYSNVSIAISRLKHWDNDKIKMIWKPVPAGK